MSLTVMILLTVIILAALFLPFTIHAVEKELEAFLLVLGVAAVSIIGAWSWPLVGHAIKEPIAISLAVLVTGLSYRIYRSKIRFKTRNNSNNILPFSAFQRYNGNNCRACAVRSNLHPAP